MDEILYKNIDNGILFLNNVLFNMNLKGDKANSP